MARRVAVGSFTVPTGSVGTTVAITGLGFKPLAIVLWWSGRTDTGNGTGRARANFGYGLAISASSRCCVSATISDASATDASGSGSHDAACVQSLDSSGTVDGLLDVQSFDQDGVTFVVDDQFPDALTVHYEAHGGEDLSYAYIGSFTEPASGSNQVITGPSAFCNTLIAISASQTSAPPSTAVDARISLGIAADNAGMLFNAAVASVSDNASDPMTAKSYCRVADCFIGFGTTANIASRGKIIEFRSSGSFVVNFSTSSSACRYFYLAMGGGQSYIRKLNTTTSTSGTIALDTKVPFTPVGALFASNVQTAESTSATLQAGGNLSLGATDGTNKRAIAVRDNDAVGTSEVTTVTRNADVFCFPAATDGTLDAAMTLNSFPANDVQTQMTDADSAAHFSWVWLVGPNTGRLDAVGSFTISSSDTVNTVISITGLAFQPRAMEFFWSGRSDTSDAIGRADTRYGYGHGTSASNRQAMSGRSTDAATSSNTGTVVSTSAVVVTGSTSDAIDGLLDIQSFNWDGASLIVTDQFPTSLTVIWRAHGGTDLNYALCGSFLEPPTTGTDKTITDPTSQCNVLIDMNQSLSSTTGAQYRTNYGVSVKEPDGTIASAQLMTSANDAVNPSVTQVYCRKAECFSGQTSGFGNVVSRGAVTAFNSDGSFVCQFSELYNTSQNRRFYWMVMGGGQNAIRKITTLTNTSSTIALDSATTFVPTGCTVVSACKAESASDTYASGVNLSIGVSDGTNNRCVGFRDNNGVSPTEVTTVIRFDDVYAQCAATAGTLDGAMTLNSFLSTGQCEFQMTDADPSGVFAWVWVTGPNAPTAQGLAAVQPFAGSGTATAGDAGVTGSGSAAVQPFATSSTATETIPSSGSAAVPPFGAAGTAAETFDGSGTAAVQPFAVGGAAAETFAGSASAALQSFATSLEGAEAIPSTGSAAVGPFGASAAATETIPSSGSAAVPPFASAGSGVAGDGAVDGSASAAMSQFGAAANATETIGSSGTAALSQFAAAASGLETIPSTATMAVSSFACAAAAALLITSVGTAALQSFACSGTASETITSSGSAAVNPFACALSGLVSQTVTATGSAAVSPFACTGTGTVSAAFIALVPGYCWILPPLDNTWALPPIDNTDVI